MDGANHARPILTYQIASGQTYYAAVNERIVYLKGDPEAGFSLYGGIPGVGQASTVNLAAVLLEFAMAWNGFGATSEARRQMYVFGGRLGQALAEQRARARPVNGVLGRTADALEDVFRSLDAAFVRRRTEREVRYRLILCPFHAVAKDTGTEREVELAHHALNAVYRSAAGALAPGLRLRLPGGPNVEQVISVVAPTSVQPWQETLKDRG